MSEPKKADPECPLCDGAGIIITEEGDAESGPMIESDPCICTAPDDDGICELCHTISDEHRDGCPLGVKEAQREQRDIEKGER